MAGVITTSQTFANTDNVTSGTLNAIASGSAFSSTADVCVNSTLAVVAGKLKVGTITSAEMGADSVLSANIKNGEIAPAKLQSTAAYTIGNLSCNAITSVGNMNVTGTITASGNITAFSDNKLKKNVETISGALSMVKQLRGVKFTFKSNNETSIGVIAQELQKVAPELVEASGEYLSVAYGNISGILIEAIKELSAKVERLENVITK